LERRDMVDYSDVSPMLTTSEVARALNVHINTVRRWSNQGILKAYRIGSRGDRRFRKEDVDNIFSSDGGPEKENIKRPITG
jgi:excisionase family DNA binding protein